MSLARTACSTKAVLPAAYRGDAYGFRMRFPSAAHLVGAPANVLAQIRLVPDGVDIMATWQSIVDGADLVLWIDKIELAPRTYVTDVQVGNTTFLRCTPFVVLADVSR